MNPIRNIVDKIKPTFEKGGKLGFLHSTFDAFETFLFVPNTVTRKGSHVRDCVDLKRVMIIVVLSLVPCMLSVYGTQDISTASHSDLIGDSGRSSATVSSRSSRFTLSHTLSVWASSLSQRSSEDMK